jgi:AraC-like DNA-binding protein
MVNYKEYKPNTTINEYIECIWTFEWENDKTNSIVETLVPGGRAEFIFIKSEILWHGPRIKKEVETISASFLLGQRNRVNYMTCLNKSSSIGVRIRHGCLPIFTDSPASIYSNKVALLNTIFGSEIDDLTMRLFDIQNKENTISIIESWLEENIHVLNNDWKNLQEFLKKIISEESYDLPTIKILSQEYGWSNKKTERLFLKYVGFTANQFIKIMRLRKSVETLFKDYQNLTKVALNSGFYDQSHFIREFYRYTGHKPSDFIKKTNNIAEFLYKNR